MQRTLFITALAILVSGLSAEEIRWINPGSGSWNEPTNWDLGRLPADEDTVLVGAGKDPIVVDASAVQPLYQELHITSGVVTMQYGGQFMFHYEPGSENPPIKRIQAGTEAEATLTIDGGRWSWSEGSISRHNARIEAGGYGHATELKFNAVRGGFVGDIGVHVGAYSDSYVDATGIQFGSLLSAGGGSGVLVLDRNYSVSVKEDDECCLGFGELRLVGGADVEAQGDIGFTSSWIYADHVVLGEGSSITAQQLVLDTITMYANSTVCACGKADAAIDNDRTYIRGAPVFVQASWLSGEFIEIPIGIASPDKPIIVQRYASYDEFQLADNTLKIEYAEGWEPTAPMLVKLIEHRDRLEAQLDRAFYSVPDDGLIYTLADSYMDGVGTLYLRIAPADWCPADLDFNGSLDIFDVFAFIEFYNAGSAWAEFNGYGGLHTQDVDRFLKAYAAGCP